MSLALQRAQVRAIAFGVSGVDAVLDRGTYSNDPVGHFKKHFVRNGKINGFVITAFPKASTIHTCSEIEEHTEWVLSGFLGCVDEDETIHEAEELANLIARTFIQNPHLNSTATWCDAPTIDPINTGFVSLGGADRLVHAITIRITAHELVSVTYS